jgi:hypothetical protein
MSSVSLDLSVVNGLAATLGRIGVFAVTPMLCLGVYTVFCAIYGYKRGEMGSLKSPVVINRKDNPRSFILLILWTAACGIAFIVVGLYWLLTSTRMMP